jgi:hypothetical protein
MLEYSWMLIFVTATGLLPITEFKDKNVCEEAVVGAQEVGTVGITGTFACVPKPSYNYLEAVSALIVEQLKSTCDSFKEGSTSAQIEAFKEMDCDRFETETVPLDPMDEIETLIEKSLKMSE